MTLAHLFLIGGLILAIISTFNPTVKLNLIAASIACGFAAALTWGVHLP